MTESASNTKPETNGATKHTRTKRDYVIVDVTEVRVPTGPVDDRWDSYVTGIGWLPFEEAGTFIDTAAGERYVKDNAESKFKDRTAKVVRVCKTITVNVVTTTTEELVLAVA